jgi:hypothetical protein
LFASYACYAREGPAVRALPPEPWAPPAVQSHNALATGPYKFVSAIVHKLPLGVHNCHCADCAQSCNWTLGEGVSIIVSKGVSDGPEANHTSDQSSLYHESAICLLLANFPFNQVIKQILRFQSW